jgi:hypothetical protein
MDQGPWEANSRSTSQIPRLLLNIKFHYRAHKNPPLVPVLSQLSPVQAFPPNSAKIHSNIIFHLSQGLRSGLFHSFFPTKYFYSFLIFVMRAASPAHNILTSSPLLFIIIIIIIIVVVVIIIIIIIINSLYHWLCILKLGLGECRC